MFGHFCSFFYVGFSWRGIQLVPSFVWIMPLANAHRNTCIVLQMWMTFTSLGKK